MAANGGREFAPVQSASARAPAATEGIADRLRHHTRELHARAESAGVVRAILSGTVTLPAYLCYLRNLHAVYECLEQELRARCHEVRWRTLGAPAIFRGAAIAADLGTIMGSDWHVRWPLLDATERYRARIRAAAAYGDARLAAHAYTRYLGDLSGGRIIGVIVGRTLALAPEQLRTYRFDDVDDLAQYKARYRQAFDAWSVAEADLLDEASAAFELNIALAEDVVAAAPGDGC